MECVITHDVHLEEGFLISWRKGVGRQEAKDGACGGRAGCYLSDMI